MGFGRMWQIVTIVFSTFASLILWRLHSQVKNPDSLGWTMDSLGSPSVSKMISGQLGLLRPMNQGESWPSKNPVSPASSTGVSGAALNIGEPSNLVYHLVYLGVLSTSICFDMFLNMLKEITAHQQGVLKGLDCTIRCCTLPGCHWLDWERNILCCFLSEIVLCIRLGSAHQSVHISTVLSFPIAFSEVSVMFSPFSCRWCWAGQWCLELLHAVSQIAEKPGRVWSRPSACCSWKKSNV